MDGNNTPRVYLAVPMQVPNEWLKNAVKALNNKGITVYYWEKGTEYNTTEFGRVIHHSHAIVVMLPDNAFKMKINSIPAGTRSELTKAIEFGKSVYLSYCSAMNVNLYATDHDQTFSRDCILSGVAGTTVSSVVDLFAMAKGGIVSTKPSWLEEFDKMTEREFNKVSIAEQEQKVAFKRQRLAERYGSQNHISQRNYGFVIPSEACLKVTYKTKRTLLLLLR